MKQSFHFHSLLFIFLVIFIHTTKATHLEGPKEGEIGVQTDGPSQMGASEVMQGEEDESFMQMMGLEDCDHNGEDECLKGRLLSEAHLDYIYTQQQNP
ncbi:putative phytosulfokines 6 [Acorus calamus]|uniref:Phytosulfokine n=1 Tax=Acorus calamus TaxID=4465 RepID=A0AAV9FD46_ACOCL|nr:putative phytosulfokines 6 [Acorus calamus]